MANTNSVPTNGIIESNGKFYAVRVDEIDPASTRYSASGKNVTLATGKETLGTIEINGSPVQVISMSTTYRWLAPTAAKGPDVRKPR